LEWRRTNIDGFDLMEKPNQSINGHLPFVAMAVTPSLNPLLQSLIRNFLKFGKFAKTLTPSLVKFGQHHRSNVSKFEHPFAKAIMHSFDAKSVHTSNKYVKLVHDPIPAKNSPLDDQLHSPTISK